MPRFESRTDDATAGANAPTHTHNDPQIPPSLPSPLTQSGSVSGATASPQTATCLPLNGENEKQTQHVGNADTTDLTELAGNPLNRFHRTPRLDPPAIFFINHSITWLALTRKMTARPRERRWRRRLWSRVRRRRGGGDRQGSAWSGSVGFLLLSFVRFVLSFVPSFVVRSSVAVFLSSLPPFGRVVAPCWCSAPAVSTAHTRTRRRARCGLSTA